MKLTIDQIQLVTDEIARNLFDDLRNSTWREQHPGAYQELALYHSDFQGTIRKVLHRFSEGTLR